MYSETLLDHFRAPRNVGMMRSPDAVGESEDPSCGDLARFYLRIEGDRVREARFQTYGCGPSIAASSIATELVRDRPVEALGELTPEAVEIGARRAAGGSAARGHHGRGRAQERPPPLPDGRVPGDEACLTRFGGM